MTRTVLLLALLGACGCGAQRSPALIPSPAAAPVSAAGQLQDDLSAIFNAPQFEQAFWSVLVRSADSSENLFSINPAKLMMPGSTMKIVTAAAAAEVLGWQHQFETTVVTAAPIENGTLRGDLIVVGGGDPSISERSDVPGTLRALAGQLHAAGIARIEGGIVGNDDLLDDRGFGDGWTLDNLPYGYSAPVSALQYNEGSVDLVVRAGAAAGDPVAVEVRPEGSGLQIDNRLITVAASGTGALTLHRLPGSPKLEIAGQIPAGAAPFVRTASVDNPTRFFVTALRHALEAEGIKVIGDAIDIDDFASKPDLSGARLLASHKSPPLRELVAAMMAVSQNQYAEMLLKSAGGRTRTRDVLKSWNIADGGYVIADGSGLSRYNYITSENLVRVLQVMRSQESHARDFAAALPVAGREGPLVKRLAGTAADGKVRAKTGTVDNVRAIAGYVEAADGETLVFSIIANNFTGSASAIDAAADRALVRLAMFSRQQQ